MGHNRIFMGACFTRIAYLAIPIVTCIANTCWDIQGTTSRTVSGDSCIQAAARARSTYQGVTIEASITNAFRNVRGTSRRAVSRDNCV
jgi:hypothetical protein